MPKKKEDYEAVIQTHLPEYYTKRVEEILKDKFLIPLLHLIGEENGIEAIQVDKDKNKLYFREHILNYLNGKIIHR